MPYKSEKIKMNIENLKEEIKTQEQFLNEYNKILGETKWKLNKNLLVLMIYIILLNL